MAYNQYVKDSALIIFANILSKFLSLISSVMILKFFAPADLGVFDLGLTIILIGLPLFTLNMAGVANVWVAGIKNPKKLVFNILILYSIFAVLGILILFILKAPLLHFFGNNLETYFFVVLFTGFASLQYTFSLYILQSLREFKSFFICNVGQSLLFLALLITDFYSGHLLVSKYRITGLFLTYLISYIPFVFYFIFKIGLHKIDFTILKKFLKRSLDVYLPYLFGFAGLFLLRLLVFRHSEIDVGILRIYDYFTIAFSFIVSSLVVVLSPLISKGGHFSSSKFVSKGVDHLLFVICVLSLTYFTVFTGVSHVLFSSKYDYTFSSYPFYVLSFIISLTSILFFSLFSSIKPMFFKAFLAYGAAGLVSILSLLLIPRTVYGYSLMLLISGIVLLLAFLFNSRFATILKHSLISLLIFFITLVGLFLILNSGISSLLKLGIGILSSALVALIFFKIKRIDPDLLLQLFPSFIRNKLTFLTSPKD